MNIKIDVFQVEEYWNPKNLQPRLNESFEDFSYFSKMNFSEKN